MKPTRYTKDNVRVLGPFGDFTYFTKISFDIPDYLKQTNGVRSHNRVDPKLTISLKVETLHLVFLPLVPAGGSWADIAPLDYINVHAEPNQYTGQSFIPLEVTFENVTPLIKIPELDKLSGGEIILDLPCLVGEMHVAGFPINRVPELIGL